MAAVENALSPEYQDGYSMGQKFARVGPASEGAEQACSAARDKHIVYFANGAQQYIGNVANQNTLNSGR